MADDAVERREHGGVRARCVLNDVASKGGNNEKPWWAEQPRNELWV